MKNEAVVKVNSKERYKELDEWGICHRCKKRPKAPGKQYCFDCLEKIREIKASYIAEHPLSEDKKREYNENKVKEYARRKEAGLCVYCGKKPATHGRFCYEHYLHSLNLQREIRAKQKLANPEKVNIRAFRKENRLCCYCGKPIEEGNPTQACNDCRKRRSEIATTANKNHVWRSDNKKAFCRG